MLYLDGLDVLDLGGFLWFPWKPPFKFKNSRYFDKVRVWHTDFIKIQFSACCNNKQYSIYIREYGSTLYVGMAWEKNGCPYISSDELKSLVIYTDKF